MKRQDSIEEDVKVIKRVTLLYLLLAGIWIIFSDAILSRFAPDIALYSRIQTYKGWIFVLVTGSLFYFYLRPRIESLQMSRKALLDAKEELHENERKYRELINGMSDTVWVIDFGAHIIDTNDAAVKTLGYSREELLTMGPADIDGSLSQEEITDLVTRMQADSIQVFETTHLTKEGKKIPVEIKSTLVDHKGKQAILCIARDITERTQARKDMEEHNTFVQAILDNLPIGLAVNEFDSGIAGYMNARFSEIYGWPKEEITDVSRFFELVYPEPDCRKEIMGRIMSDIQSGDINRMHWEDISIQTKDRGKRWVSAVNIPILDQNIIVSTVQDVTERKHVEEEFKRRLDYELATVECMRLLLEAGDVDIILPRILERIHRTVGDSRSYIFQNETDPQLGLCMSQIYEIVGEGVTEQIENPLLKHLPYSDGSPMLLAALQSRQHYAHLVEELGEPDRTILAEQGVLSVLILPIFSGPDLWGFIGFDDCVRARHWNEDDIKLLRVVADGIGETILRKTAENGLKESEERFKALHNASFGGIAIHDKGIILDCNLGLAEMSGYTVEELIGMNGLLLIAEDYRDLVVRNILAGYEEPYEARGLRKDGTGYPLRVEARNIPYKGKQVRVVEFRDITEQKRSEAALRESEAKLSSMISNISDVIAVIDRNGVNRFKSPNIERWFGWKPEDIVGASTWENIHPDDLSQTQEIFARLLDRPGHTLTSESRYRCKDGTHKWMEFTATNLLHDSAIKGILLNYHDITYRRKAEDELREGERKFRSYVESAPYGIFITDENGRYLEVNKAASELTGYPEDELVGVLLSDMLSPEFRLKSQEVLIGLRNNGYASDEQSFVRKDGTVIWLKIDATKLSETRYLVFASDITEKKKAEYSLIEAKLMAEENNRIKSEFLANMSHELRTPLTAVIGFSDILIMQKFGELNSKQLDFTGHILNSGKHLLELINNILDLSKVEAGKMELNCEDFSIDTLLEEIQKILYPLAARKNIEISLKSDIQHPEIFADKFKLKQVMYNLLSNAIKFTPDNGRVLVTARRDDKVFEISVSDNGIGIPVHRQEEIFDPFMQVDASNKRKYGGTGLGLALARRFVEMHDGRIRVESEEGKGSTFTFTIMDQGDTHSQKSV